MCIRDRFTNTSLEKLVKNMRKDKLKILQQCMRTDGNNEEEERAEMLVKKGFYTYEYVTDERKYEDVSLPAPEHFYNRLAETPVSDEDYAHAYNVWTAFGMRTLGEYHNPVSYTHLDVYKRQGLPC